MDNTRESKWMHIRNTAKTLLNELDELKGLKDNRGSPDKKFEKIKYRVRELRRLLSS
jgi:hypothetical protein